MNLSEGLEASAVEGRVGRFLCVCRWLKTQVILFQLEKTVMCESREDKLLFPLL